MKAQIHIFLLLVLIGLGSYSCENNDSNVPEACFVASQERKTGIPIDFSTSCSINASSYLWDFGDGQSSEEAYPSHTYYERGDYAVTLTVANVNGDTDDVTHVMVIEDPV